MAGKKSRDRGALDGRGGHLEGGLPARGNSVKGQRSGGARGCVVAAQAKGQSQVVQSRRQAKHSRESGRSRTGPKMEGRGGVWQYRIEKKVRMWR